MRHSATAATPRGTTPSDGLLTRIVAKPYARRSCETNYQRLPANGVCHEKSSSWPKPSCFWPLNVIQSSESAVSEKVDDILMWSHYSQNHTGFCLEFDTSFEPFDKVHKVSALSEKRLKLIFTK